MPHISENVLYKTAEGIRGLLEDYKADIEMAYCNEEDSLTLAISVKYSLPKSGSGVQVDTGLTFVKEKIKAKITDIVDPNKDSLFKAIDGMRPKKGSGVDSVTLEAGGESVTLESQ